MWNLNLCACFDSNDDGHHSEEGLSDRISDCQILESGEQLSLYLVSPAKMWQQILGYICFAGIVRSKGQGQDVAP